MFIDKEREILQKLIDGGHHMICIADPYGRTFTEKYKVYQWDWEEQRLKLIMMNDDGEIVGHRPTLEPWQK